MRFSNFMHFPFQTPSQHIQTLIRAKMSCQLRLFSSVLFRYLSILVLIYFLISGQVRKSDVTHAYYSCPNSFVTFDNAMKFAAEASFAGVQGRLWAPGSPGESYAIVEGMMYSFHKDYAWFAFSDAAVEGKWAVMVGPNIGTDMFELIPWGAGEPNGGTGENCVVVAPGIAWAVDYPCSQLAKYIIEFKCPFGQRFNDQASACIGMPPQPH